MFSLLVFGLLMLCVVAVLRRCCYFMVWRRWHMQVHGDRLDALHGEPQRHENHKKFDEKTMHDFYASGKPCKMQTAT